MADREGLYLKLPIAVQHAACSLEGWRIQHSRFGDPFTGLMEQAESRTLWPADLARRHRDMRLQAFVRHCARTVPYYRRRFEECGISPEEIRTLEDLRRLPILTKREVQEHYAELQSEAVHQKRRIIIHTSGTTGGGLRFATTLCAVQEQWATWWRYRRWHGLDLGTWCAYFGGRSVVPLAQTRPPFWRYNVPGRQVLFSGYHMSPANLAHYVEELRRRRLPWLHGYPSLLALLAAYLLDSGAGLGYQPRWITAAAENVLPQQADLIEQAFGSRLRQHYGMAEAVANISECPYGALHVDEDFAAVEFLPNPDGPGYKVIGTNFTNVATPLLRYDVQDLAALSDAICPCGRPGRVVEAIDGRKEDYIILKSGARLGRMDHIFKDMVHIREAQIYQKEPGQIIIRIVPGSHYSESDEAALLSEARKRVGDDTDIIVEHVEGLQRSSTGKLRFVTSEVPEGGLERVHA